MYKSSCPPDSLQAPKIVCYTINSIHTVLVYTSIIQFHHHILYLRILIGNILYLDIVRNKLWLIDNSKLTVFLQCLTGEEPIDFYFFYIMGYSDIKGVERRPKPKVRSPALNCT